MQTTITLPRASKGLYDITESINAALPDSAEMSHGIAHIFLMHTSAALTINENCDPDVQYDLQAAMDTLAPESNRYLHDAEGPDDMPAHIKSSLAGVSLSVPFKNKKLVLGTWQGIFLWEFRTRAHQRKITLTCIGNS